MNSLIKYNLTAEQEKKLEELQQMSPQQWDTICKRCGLCCLCKIGFSDIGKTTFFYTKICCDGFDPVTKRCNIYENRLKIKGNACKKLDLDVIMQGKLVPRSCGYVEYIFGPAPFKPFVDWRNVKSEKQVNMNAPGEIMQNIILESCRWNKR